MSVEAIVWALNVPVGGAAKVILLGIANHAGADFEEARPAVDTLARYAHCDRRTVQRHLRQLESDGWIIRTGWHAVGGRADRSVAVWKLSGRQDATPPERGDKSTPRGDGDDANGATPVSPEPSIEPSKEPSTAQRAQTRARGAAELPPGFPHELKPHARQVYAILRDVAVRFGAKEITPRAVGHAIMSAPGCHYVAEAHKMAGWCESTNRPVKDVTARYQNWLKGADIYAGPENLGAPIAASAGGNVHQMRRRGGGGTPWSAAEMLELGRQMQ